jgi:hypothetical protein
MSAHVCRRLVVLVAAAAALAGCSRATTIKQDLVLGPRGAARIDLHQATEAIELVNDSTSVVRIKVLGRKDAVVSNMVLNAHDRARLDILPDKAIQFDNQGDSQALVRWTLRNSDRIDFTLALQP